MKSILHCLLTLTLFLVGCASEEGPPAISANSQPLTFQVIFAAVTRGPQLQEQLREQLQTVLSGFDLEAAAAQSGYTYTGPVIKQVKKVEVSYEPIPLTTSES